MTLQFINIDDKQDREYITYLLFFFIFRIFTIYASRHISKYEHIIFYNMKHMRREAIH